MHQNKTTALLHSSGDVVTGPGVELVLLHCSVGHSSGALQGVQTVSE
jgi:hypothetical protein